MGDARIDHEGNRKGHVPKGTAPHGRVYKIRRASSDLRATITDSGRSSREPKVHAESGQLLIGLFRSFRGAGKPVVEGNVPDAAWHEPGQPHTSADQRKPCAGRWTIRAGSL